MSQVAVLRRRVAARTGDLRGMLAARTEGARTWARPVTEVVSPTAWALVVTVPVSALAAALWRWGELRVAVLLILPLLALTVLFVIGRYQLTATLDLTRDRVTVGERALGRVLLTNTSRRRSLPGMVELPVGLGRADFDIPSLAAGADLEDVFVILTTRRAVLDVGPVLAVRSDPLGLFRREQHLTDAGLLYVHPRTVRIDGTAAGLIRDLEGQPIAKITDSDVSFHALRGYVAGDDRRHIHWKTSARTGQLMIRQFEETRRSHLLLALSTRLDEYGGDEEFELAVSVAGSLALQTFADSHELSVTTSLAAYRIGPPSRLLDQFAGVDFEAGAPRLPDVARRVGRDVGGVSVAVMIGGSLLEPAAMRAARRHLPLDVRTIALRCAPGQETTLRQLGDVTVGTVGDLEELGPLLRRMT